MVKSIGLGTMNNMMALWDEVKDRLNESALDPLATTRVQGFQAGGARIVGT